MFAVASTWAKSERFVVLLLLPLPQEVPNSVLCWEKPSSEGDGGARRVKGPSRVRGEEKVEYERVIGEARRRGVLERGNKMSRVVMAAIGVLAAAGLRSAFIGTDTIYPGIAGGSFVLTSRFSFCSSVLVGLRCCPGSILMLPLACHGVHNTATMLGHSSDVAADI